MQNDIVGLADQRRDPPACRSRSKCAVRTTRWNDARDGLSKREIIRCLKRYLAREVYRLLPTSSEEPGPLRVAQTSEPSQMVSSGPFLPSFRWEGTVRAPHSSPENRLPQQTEG